MNRLSIPALTEHFTPGVVGTLIGIASLNMLGMTPSASLCIGGVVTGLMSIVVSEVSEGLRERKSRALARKLVPARSLGFSMVFAPCDEHSYAPRDPNEV
jgi:hypothetical protein